MPTEASSRKQREEGSKQASASHEVPNDNSESESQAGAGDCQPWQLRLAHCFMMLVVLRLPFFEVPCDKGVCTSPVEIVAVELYAYDRCPHTFVKMLLYPGAFAEGLQDRLSGQPVRANATWQHLLDDYKRITLKEAYQQPVPKSWEMFKDQKMDLIGGSFIVVFGALMSFYGPFLASSLGMGLLYLHVLGDGHPHKNFMSAAAICSLAWIPVHLLFEAPTEPQKPVAPVQAPKLKTRGKFKVY